MPKTRKNKRVKKHKNYTSSSNVDLYKNKMFGGILEEHKFPECNILSQFQISDANMSSFSRVFPSPTDCVISALQIMNIIDATSANIMRVATLGKQTMDKKQIEIIFCYAKRHNFMFKPTNSYEEWSNWISRLLEPGHVVFAGYTGHVFLIGRHLDGSIIYIDPQVSNPCNLNDPECEKYLRNKQTWFLLFNSQEQLTSEQEQLLISYTQYLQNQ